MKQSKTKKIQTRKQMRRADTADITGMISITAANFGFVTPISAVDEQSDEKIRDIFIPPQFLCGAMDGDKVKVALLPERPSDNPSFGAAGRVVEVVERCHPVVVGELISGHKVRALNKRIQTEIEVTGGLNGAARGDWVQLDMHYGAGGKKLCGSIGKKIGKAGDINSDLDAICAEHHLVPPYTEEENRSALKIVPAEIDREDFRDRKCIVIDPPDAKDFDDALSFAKIIDNDTIELGVHIADVAAWIPSGSAWDKRAFLRGFTAYLPGRTLPMLPKSLTARISLTEGVDSYAHSVIFTVCRHTGRVLSHRRHHTVIRVNKRLCYDEVQEFIDTGKHNWSDDIAEIITIFVEITRKMRAHRQSEEHFLDMAIPEIRVLCDETKNEIIGLVNKVQHESEQIIEECMLAANTAVAVEMLEKTIPAIFRIHPEPDPEKLDEFTTMMVATFGIIPGDLTSRIAACRFLNNLPDNPHRPIILNAFLRSLPRASYSAESGLHFGLGKYRYSHFTSPIRRYTDLAVHQQLWNHEVKTKLRSIDNMEIIAESCSAKEITIDEACYCANDRLKLRYLQEQMADGQQNLHSGIIARIVSGGMMVDILSLGIYGFVPYENLPGKFTRTSTGVIESERGGKSYRCGDGIVLQLAQIDLGRGSAVFRPARVKNKNLEQ
jgi:ribonuclease R